MAFGLDYRYVEAGNDVFALIEAFEQVKDTDHPVVVHIHTRKGLGLPPARNPRKPATPGFPWRVTPRSPPRTRWSSKDDMRRTIGRSRQHDRAAFGSAQALREHGDGGIGTAVRHGT